MVMDKLVVGCLLLDEDANDFGNDQVSRFISLLLSSSHFASSLYWHAKDTISDIALYLVLRVCRMAFYNILPSISIHLVTIIYRPHSSKYLWIEKRRRCRFSIPKLAPSECQFYFVQELFWWLLSLGLVGGWQDDNDSSNSENFNLKAF